MGKGPPASPTAPSRPAREPGMDLRLPDAALHAELQDGLGELRAPKQRYAMSTRSGFSGISNRSSIISTSSSVLYDRPTIVTSAKVGRQILGVVRAEVVPMNSAPNSPGGSTTHFGLQSAAASLRSRPSIRSPLAGNGYTAGEEDVPPVPSITSPVSPAMSVRSDPFSDAKSPNTHTHFNNLDPASLPLPESRIGSALPSPTTPTGTIPDEDARLASPTSPQHTQYPPPSIPSGASRFSAMKHFRQESQSSFVSSTSRADSIMNGFAFLPPTPPLPASFSRAHSLAASSDVLPDEPHADGGASSSTHTVGGAALARRATNYSVMSSSSAMSSGLDAFPFQFGSSGMGGAPPVPDSGRNTLQATAHPPPMSNIMATARTQSISSTGPPRSIFGNVDAHRASLDTLVLSREIDEYALPYDRDH